MTDTELIAKQAKKIEELREELDETNGGIRSVHMLIFGIGGPLNDNMLGFTVEQRSVFHRIAEALDLD